MTATGELDRFVELLEHIEEMDLECCYHED
jgi:hypothetical protein